MRSNQEESRPMTVQANLTMALPPGWAALDKDALLTALDEGFVTLDATDGALLTRIRAAETHLLAFMPSPATGKPEAILTATVVDNTADVLGIGKDHSDEWEIKRWADGQLIGGAVQASRAARTFAIRDTDALGLVSLYEADFGPGRPGVVVTTLMKLHRDLADEAIDLLDEIAATISVVPIT